MTDYKTLTNLIVSRKNEENKGITFILSDSDECFVSYKELYNTALKVLHGLQELGFKPGDEVIFQIDDNQRFVYSFWACILGGMIPVPVTTGTNDEHKMKLFKIWDVLRNPRIILSEDFLGKLEGFAEKNSLSLKMNHIRNRMVYAEEIIRNSGYGQIYEAEPDSIAFIQFSSGSTGEPKGVIITHKNVLVDLSSVIRWESMGPEDSGLNWMPLTHDMGLIGTHIKGVLACINQYNMQTQLFIRHPTLWMEKASQHKATILYSPNFGYKHFLKFMHSDTPRNWDLSSVRLIYNGAEPISLDLCNEFLDEMSMYGLKRSAMHPVYGLAEGTIAVTLPNPGEKFAAFTLDRNYLKVGDMVRETAKEDIKGITFVDVGYPIYECFLRICDENNNELAEDQVGYIQIKGGNVTCGYYNNKAATEQAITPDGWLNTGDLGFLRNQRLIITGRAKDVIFMAGQNYYSHDIERIIESIDGLELGKVAAAGVFNEKLNCDELVVFVMFKQKAENFVDTALDIKRIINQKMGIETSEVIPIKSIPKTTSGKVQRYKLRESYIKGEYDAVKREINGLIANKLNNRSIAIPRNAIEENLAGLWSEILNIPKLGIHDNFFELGGDSLRVTQLISRVRDIFGVELEQAELFDNPTIGKLAEIIGKAGEKRMTKEELIERVSVSDGHMSLSYAQQRLWFLDRLNMNSSQYNLYKVFRFQGRLNTDALAKSINEVIKRHSILQVSFGEENGHPVQVLNGSSEFKLAFVDLSHIPEPESEQKAIEIAREEARKPFDLGKAPLLKGTILRLNENNSILVLVVHHIVFDGWSFGILLKELSFHYENFLAGKEQSLPELKIQYTDFAEWQVKSNYDANQLAYWKKQLGGKLPVIDLPVDKQRPPIQTYSGAKFTSFIPGELVQKLQSLARKENATLFMVLLAAFKLLLYRYTGQTDILVGSPIANRNRKDIEELVGFFTNNMVLRTSFTADTSFKSLLQNVKKVTLEAYSNQSVPFEKLVEELHVERDMSRNPLFQILFSLQNTPLQSVELPDVDISTVDIDSGFARFDLALDIREAGSELAVDFEYNTDLFYSDTISRMAGHFRQILDSIADDPSKVLDRFELLTRAERNTILKEWNNTRADLHNAANWIMFFEAWAEKTPDAPAVTGSGVKLTYRELNNHANRLANYLISIGVGRETIVGVYVSRSPRMLEALLAVHKAGGAYLPMDPIFPRERLEYMVEDAQVDIILTERSLTDMLPPHNAKIICLDSSNDEFVNFSTENTAVRRNPADLAYVLYTSGSTGRPKGVQIEQSALINFLMSMLQKTGMTEKDRLLAVTTLSFDIAGLELFMPLIAGAGIILAGSEEVIDGSALGAMLYAHDITFMQATPATWRLLIESGWKGSSKLNVLCGGEAFPRDLADQLLDRCACLWNVYGPTETTIWSTMAKVEKGTGAVTIGKPIANTQVYVLDHVMNPVPVGIPGELYIGGDGLARGYLNQPQLTGEKFIPDLFSGKIGARLYRTGDLVKFLPDGNLEFVGRKDHQVKIRGFRIELGEIESVLNFNPMVKESVVAAKDYGCGGKSLVAYIIPSQKQQKTELTAENLRKYLKEKLPDYMVPSAFMIVDSFKMTPNGKINRKALPIPESLRPQLGTDYVEPSSGFEKQITAIWREVLKLERIGVNDNFFDLGGHSLLLAQVRSGIMKTLNKDVSMMDLFKYPTIYTLSRYLEGKMEADPVNKKCRQADGEKTGGTDIAVIGLSGRFPGAANTGEFWKNLCNGVESIRHFTDEEVIEEGVDPEAVKKAGYVKAWGALEDIDKFDANFFGYNPREAEVLDPQQRIFLEEAWKALENAGYDAGKYQGSIGVFASVGMNTYIRNLDGRNGSQGLASDYQVMISNDKDFLATRVSYKLNLEGPSVTVQTACSSSLVAVHLACQNLINKECDMALAGGVSIRLPQKSGYLYQEGMILSPDGHCRAFDEKSKGTVGGNGAGIVVLKRLDDAIADGDCISAVIKGSAINNDGALKVGYTAPRIDGQAGVIMEAQAKAGIDPETITYIEAHGTGTPLGDPIEIEALRQAFSKKTDKKGFCAVGSAKTNIGHLDSAAGVTGFIKTVLALRNRMIPPSLNYSKPNPKIDFENSPFFVNTELKEWKNTSNPLRAGVSSFGIGGTNAHVVLEEAPAVIDEKREHKDCLLVFSAKTNSALDRLTADFAKHLKTNTDINMADAAYTLQIGRKEMEFRRFLVCTSREDAIEALESMQSHRVYSSLDGQSVSNDRFDETRLESYTLQEIGQFWLSGVKIDWNRLCSGQKLKRIPLPAYPFEGRSFWVKKENKTSENHNSGKKTGKPEDISEWFYTPVWKQSVEALDSNLPFVQNEKDYLLVLTNDNNFSGKLIKQLRQRNKNIIKAVSGSEFIKTGDADYIFRPVNPEDYDNLLKNITGSGKNINKVINLLGVTEVNKPIENNDKDGCGELLFYSLVFLAQAFGNRELRSQIQIKVLTNNSQKIFSETDLYPEKALHLGPCRVIPREYPNVTCSSVDFILPEQESLQEHSLIEQLIDEINMEPEKSAIAYRGQERWIQEFEKIKLGNGNNSAVPLKQGGVYLITGGLGGLGLVMANYLAREARARLVLLSRSEFPAEEQWDEWLKMHGKYDRTARIIKQLKRCQGYGAEIFVCKADVTDTEQLNAVRGKIIQKYGRINGIIHAAGLPGGGMIQIKTREFAEKVLAPKVYGTKALYAAFKESRPDFYILCSSLNAITGGFGQADYSAANAFLDAFAQVHDSRKGTRIISINWDRWPGVGMAAGIGVQSGYEEDDLHPLLGRKISDSLDKTVYMTELSPEKDWVLAEHLVMGTPTIAGTTYLEMVRAAIEEMDNGSLVQIRDVVFLTPLVVAKEEKRSVITIIEKNNSAKEFRILSRLDGAENKRVGWQEHARGKIELLDDVQTRVFDICDLEKGCHKKVMDFSQDGQKPSEDFISFGNRWRSLRKLSIEENEALAEVELPQEYASDLETYKLHPAVLDIATGSVRLAGEGNYLPFSYEKLVIKGDMPRKVYAHIRFKNGYSSSQEIITSDIDILNGNGAQVVEIRNFSMKLTGKTAVESIKARTMGGRPADIPGLEKMYAEAVKKQSGVLNEGITSEEGQEVLQKILKGCFRSQILVSTKDIQTAIYQANYIDQPGAEVAYSEDASLKEKHPRPDMKNEYIPPKNETEKKLAQIWGDILGIDPVGIHDEFFELGGDSLLLVQLHSKIKDTFNTEMAVVDLYKYNTIASIAKYLSSDNHAEEQPSFEAVNQRASKQIDMMKQRRQMMLQRKGAIKSE
ncbi:MAG TPA: amino acid adenylation domain-containing protein [Ruminiclostridium sp.]|nr:amino acid adenylation domain-containing protein [Ruminiclostridium sp.]